MTAMVMNVNQSMGSFVVCNFSAKLRNMVRILKMLKLLISWKISFIGWVWDGGDCKVDGACGGGTQALNCFLKGTVSIRFKYVIKTNPQVQ